jgi:hypothetical protein
MGLDSEEKRAEDAKVIDLNLVPNMEIYPTASCRPPAIPNPNSCTIAVAELVSATAVNQLGYGGAMTGIKI